MIERGFMAQAHRDRTTYRKLTEEGVREIRRMRQEGMTIKAIAERIGVGKSTVGDVLSGLNHGSVR